MTPLSETGSWKQGGATSGPSSLSTRSPRRPAVEAVAGERARVLAVDDDPQALRYVRDILANAGYTPVVDGGPGAGAPPRGRGEARPDPARPDAPWSRRHRADDGHLGDGRRADHLPVGLRPGRAHRQGGAVLDGDTTSGRSDGATSLHLFRLCRPQTAWRTQCCCPQEQHNQNCEGGALTPLVGEMTVLYKIEWITSPAGLSLEHYGRKSHEYRPDELVPA